jgi:hypothetical protein
MIDDYFRPRVVAGVEQKGRATSVALLREMMRALESSNRDLSI